MILADTSMWIEHLRHRDEHLAALLTKQQILIHSMVIGELACGSLADRDALIWRWQRLPHLDSASDEAVLAYIEDRCLMGRGIGFVDAHLLAAVARVKHVRLWSYDKRLSGAAVALDLAIDSRMSA